MKIMKLKLSSDIITNGRKIYYASYIAKCVSISLVKRYNWLVKVEAALPQIVYATFGQSERVHPDCGVLASSVAGVGEYIQFTSTVFHFKICSEDPVNCSLKILILKLVQLCLAI